jgi:type I restriction enzyme S subunit
VAEFEGICSAHALVLRARSDVCLPEFLPFFLQSDQFHERALDISVGSLSPTINWKTLAIQEFALPPVAEQRLIVDVLKAHGEVVQSLEEVRSAAQTLYEAVGESVSRQAKKTEALADLLVHLIDHRGKTPKKLGTDFVSKGVPVVSAMNVFDDRVHLEGTKSIDADVWERWMPVKLERNDLLMTSEAPLGRTALVDSDQPLCLGQRLFALRFDPKRVEPSYAKAFFDARTGQASLLSRATGSTVLGIRASALRELHLPLLPLEEQRQLGLLAQKVLSIREQLHAELLAVRRLGTSIRRELLEVRSPNVR